MGDEASARGLLAEMQARLARDPYEALGLAGAPSAADVRQAFLRLTKTFHPQKFARMAPEIQKLANEVFLALRAAHDTLSRPSVAPTNRQSGAIPSMRLPTTPGAPASGTQPRLPTTPQRLPTGQNPVIARARAPSSPPTPQRPPSGPRLAQPSPPPQVVAPAATGPSEKDLAPILELFKLGQISAAKVALETLTARVPNIPRYQSLLHYARGREAQLAKRLDEARVELQDALQIDPDLAMAKTALAELFTRRK